MIDFTTFIPSSTTSPGLNPGVRLRGTIGPFIAHRFGSGHIAPFAPFVGVFSLLLSGIDTRVHSLGGDRVYVNVRANSYIPSYIPFSTIHVPSISFLMSHPPYILHGPLGSNAP